MITGNRECNLLFTTLALAFLLFAVAPKSIAQTDITSENEEAERVLPEIVVRGGPLSWRRGLAAYYSGDYVEAERQFRSFRNGINSRLLDISPAITRGDFSNGTLSTRTTTLVFETPNQRISASPRIGALHRKTRNLGSPGVSNDENNFAQASYALGANLIKQGKFAEAKLYFSSAVGRDRDLHDARVRLGLIALLQDKLPLAERRLGELERYCGALSCDDDGELSVSIATLRAAISFYVGKNG